ncbi:winged helix-turn-helix transcriptional regulator [Prauserella oleivorans]|uniref:HTH hxlR-type domain-containing protein n=3 Tax=Prauserella TaxID=142577 RepID=A0A2V4AVW8_9PSEU|nr:hypothetical protein BAY60_18730 [Prauserella muralis]
MRDLYRWLNRKWEPVILTVLARKPMRYTELRDTIQKMNVGDEWYRRPGSKLTDKVLGETLSAMQDDGLVLHQRDTSTIPPAATYALTATARQLLNALRPAVEWVADHHDLIEKAKTNRRTHKTEFS